MSRRTNKIKPLLILWLATAMITVVILIDEKIAHNTSTS